MDLLLGVADLHSEQAVEAAEATMNGFRPSGMPVACSSSDPEDDSDDSDEDGDRPIVSDIAKCKGPDEAETDPAEGKKPNKRQKIVVLNQYPCLCKTRVVAVLFRRFFVCSCGSLDS